MNQENVFWWFTGGCCLWHFGLVWLAYKIGKHGAPLKLNQGWQPKWLTKHPNVPSPTYYAEQDDEVYQ